MLVVGCALMNRPDMLILDELSLGLAPLVVQDIYQLLDTVRERMTGANDRYGLEKHHLCICFGDRQVVWRGPSAELIAGPEIKKAYLGSDPGCPEMINLPTSAR